MSLEVPIDQGRIDRCRDLARQVADALHRDIEPFSTVAVERAVLRLWGVESPPGGDEPLVNLVVDRVRGAGRLPRGVARAVAEAAVACGATVQGACEAIAREGLPPIPAASAGRDEQERPGRRYPGAEAVDRVMAGWTQAALERIRARRAERERLQADLGESPPPLLYSIVATGSIFADVEQAVAAVEAGADCIAVIRSTAQSLLDYVPEGITTEGFGGTYATQANFRAMREALDQAAARAGRYIRLVNYASGLCMPEISVLGAIERLDMLLNDSMYGIIFRDINPRRTFVDQHFSRQVSAAAGHVINTGEDNYVTTADPIEAAHTVLASQFINERLALDAGLEPRQIGLGHAFEIDPAVEDGFLLELAQAQMIRQIFPAYPLKYMPPTRPITGDIFRAYRVQGMFDLVSILTRQSIHLVGVLTEAVHTPHLADRFLALRGARYIHTTARHLADELDVAPNGRMARRAQEVVRRTEAVLEEIARTGLYEALARGTFADTKRPFAGGRGADGVFEKADDYLNPFDGALHP